MTTARPKKLRTGKLAVHRPPVPKCRTHSADMVYRPELMLWKCIVDGCASHRRPNIGGDDRTPIVLPGDVELVTHVGPTGTTDYYLRHREQNLLIHLTEHIGTCTTNGVNMAEISLILNVVEA